MIGGSVQKVVGDPTRRGTMIRGGLLTKDSGGTHEGVALKSVLVATSVLCLRTVPGQKAVLLALVFGKRATEMIIRSFFTG